MNKNELKQILHKEPKPLVIFKKQIRSKFFTFEFNTNVYMWLSVFLKFSAPVAGLKPAKLI